MNSQEQEKQELTRKQGQALLTLARLTLVNELQGTRHRPEEEILSILAEPELKKKQGVFVTLYLKEKLRGCIGSLSGEKSIVEGVKENALNAALNDPRFPPLTPGELEVARIEISVLTEPKKLGYVDAKDLVRKLRPHVDGVILKKGGAKSTFLPQVWEQLKDPHQFLSQLCLKAGLPSEAWKTDKPEILTYQVQYFEEPKPSGQTRST